MSVEERVNVRFVYWAPVKDLTLRCVESSTWHGQFCFVKLILMRCAIFMHLKTFMFPESVFQTFSFYCVLLL